MKAIQLTFIAVFGIISFGFAQVKPIQKALLQTPGVQCETCKVRIESRLAHEYGLSSVKADFKKHTVAVVYYSDRTNIETIKTALANMGYNADDVTADSGAYKRLPKTCQHEAAIKPGEKK